MNSILDVILGGLHVVYGNRWVAPFVVVPVMFLFAAYVRHRAIRATRVYLIAAQDRADALTAALGNDPDPIAERRSFADNYISVSSAMYADQPGAGNLISAWRQFQECLVGEDSIPLRNTTRPSSFFNRMAPRQTELTFWSNIFVGAGLILTFVGLIVALDAAATGMAGSDINAAKNSLNELLTVAGAKFFTSVAGLGASIWLRFTEHGLTKAVRRKTDLICDLLERGLLYMSPQSLAAEQLEVLKEQRDQLKFFNTDVALQLSERIGVEFTQAIAPVAASISALNDNMSAVTQGIGAGAQKAIEEVSGQQLRGLSESLAGLSQQLTSINQAVSSSSNEAASQIRLAGEDFAKAASDIRQAFDRLTSDIDQMGRGLSERGEAAGAAQKDALAGMLASIEDAQARSSAMITQAVAALQSASSDAATSMRGRVSEALEDGVRASQETFRVAIEESGSALRETAGTLSKAVSEAASQVERVGVGLNQTTERASTAADSMRLVADGARSVAGSLEAAAQGFSTAATPVADAARSIKDATDKLTQTVDTDRKASMEAVSEMRGLAEGVRATHEAAESAWRDYRARFEGVDNSLATTTEKLAQTLGDSLTEFRKFAQDTDREMAAAVSKLSNTVTQIEEYAESLDDFVTQNREMSVAAE
ncbi:anti-phage ZorAB system protein ZorA [Sphingomonas sp. LY160]|uniref:anti-phage ZorAB system protein ZorA n=1 Tax=Sphingomonas sp. LY160 TaxID=3095342 RepID=UPI002ADEE939|nr:anti-phage ZorAB system protein ZorA [Sphingomonas sp. LY160]MEA1071742.1 anti-phage ZorAB system protein ZorA [Sphingomonas sp. LY160]